MEKTIVDCFDLPHYSGGYSELIRAFTNAPLENKALISACTAINNIAAIKRMGYLAEFCDKKDMNEFILFAKEQVKDRYNLFDPLGQEEGEFVSDWKLRMNIPLMKLTGIIDKHH